jgi:hypothetical protein
MQESDLQKWVKDPCLGKENYKELAFAIFWGYRNVEVFWVTGIQKFYLKKPELDLD